MELTAQYWSFAWHLFSTCPGVPTLARTHASNGAISSYLALCGSRNGHYPGATGMRNTLTLTATFTANYCPTAIGLVYFGENENETSDFPPPTTSCLT